MTYSHGGEIYDKNVRLDFSVSLNPLGCPKSVTEALVKCGGEISRYPDIRYRELRRSLADYENKRYCSDGINCITVDMIVPLSGASEGITAIAGTFSGKKVLIKLPAFGGYERAFENAKCEICYSYPNTFIIEQIKDIKPDLVVIGSPSNPLGQLIGPDELNNIVSSCKNAGCFLLCDEAFMGFVQGRKEYSLSRFFSEYSRLIIIRSFTKLYSCPGLRLGYAVTPDTAIAESISARLPEWNISLPAEKAMLALCKEGDFADKSAEYVAMERKRMLKEMSDMEKSGADISPVASDVNYIFFKSEEYLYDKLLERGTLIRKCDDYKGIDGKDFYRIGLKTRKENDELLDEIKKLICG